MFKETYNNPLREKSFNCYISTWFCLDEKDDESTYSQMKSVGKSSSMAVQRVYWQNIYVFYYTFKRYNPGLKFLFFSNVGIPDNLDGFPLKAELEKLGVVAFHVPFNYKTPTGYHGAWRNQFFEFSIFEKALSVIPDKNSLFMLLDSDCVCVKNVQSLIDLTAAQGYSVMKMLYEPDHVINGISRRDMKGIFENLSGTQLDHIPEYYGGEFFFMTLEKLQKVVKDFQDLWPKLLELNTHRQPKLNEEAHVLSYIFYRNGWIENLSNDHIKRLWTQPFIYRNVLPQDANLSIWHLPHEKKYGILNLYKQFSKNPLKYQRTENSAFLKRLNTELTVPKIPLRVWLFRLIPVQTARYVYYAFKK
jgi:hypothetical protein